MDDTNFVYGYEGTFHDVGRLVSSCDEVDVHINCECGKDFYIYSEGSVLRCKNCGRIYKATIYLEMGDEWIPDGDQRIYIPLTHEEFMKQMKELHQQILEAQSKIKESEDGTKSKSTEDI
jgi:hypothetical protein